MTILIEILKSLLVGFICGFIFAMFKLPVPAPTVFAGVAGILGITLGYMVFAYLFNKYFH